MFNQHSGRACCRLRTSLVDVLAPAGAGLPAPSLPRVLQVQHALQFWVHTCCIRRLGILEYCTYVLMTPSHHRVHHDRRVHKNFSGVLIVWDQLFGSFLDELAVYKSTAAAKPARQTAERVNILYLGGPSAIPVPAEAAPKARREEKVLTARSAPRPPGLPRSRSSHR